MGLELPEPVRPLDGAAQVDFPWAGAVELYAAFDDIAETLNLDMDNRPDAIRTLSDWRGRYRDDFDATMNGIAGAVSSTIEDCRTYQGHVYDACEQANEIQQGYNDIALDPDATERYGDGRDRVM